MHNMHTHTHKYITLCMLTHAKMKVRKQKYYYLKFQHSMKGKVNCFLSTWKIIKIKDEIGIKFSRLKSYNI